MPLEQSLSLLQHLTKTIFIEDTRSVQGFTNHPVNHISLYV